MPETTMCALVIEVREDALLVRDQSTCQEVQVNTSCAHCYSAGDRICIRYSGAMTNSLPPQISADCIRRAGSCG